MPERSSKKKRLQTNPQQLTRRVAPDAEPPKKADASEGKNPAAVALGRLGGLKGGKARAAKLSKAKRSAIAKKAAAARWKQADF